MKRLTVVIPTREKTLPLDNITLVTLNQQTWRDFRIVIQPDFGHGANWARNAGFTHVDTELVMFCDDDIEWHPDSLNIMVKYLDAHPKASYVYCAYEMDDKIFCNIPFDSRLMKLVNFVSTMTLLRSVDFAGFDLNIKRFQDWDHWLTLLSRGKVGVWCERTLFRTKVRQGITFNNELTPHKATEVIMRKHRVWMSPSTP